MGNLSVSVDLFGFQASGEDRLLNQLPAIQIQPQADLLRHTGQPVPGMMPVCRIRTFENFHGIQINLACSVS